MTLFMGNGDTLRAKKMAEEIINKPVKIPSQRVDEISKRAKS